MVDDTTHFDFIYGINAVADRLRHDPDSVVTLYYADSRSDKRLRALLDRAAEYHIDLQRSDTKALDALVGGRHQGVAVKVPSVPMADEASLDRLLESTIARGDTVLLLVLDGVTDPHNLGACLRSADAAGAQAVIVPRDNSAGLTAVVRKVASGAAETTPVIAVTNLARCLRKLQRVGIWLYGAAGEADMPLYQVDFSAHSAIVMGAEGSGLRRLTRESCDQLFSIPLQGAVESLNVSVAAGAVMNEVVRQRGRG